MCQALCGVPHPETSQKRPTQRMRGPFSRLTDSWVPPDPRRSPQRASKPPEDVISAEASQLCVGAGDRCSAVQEDGDTRSKHLELLFHRLHPADQPPSPDRGLAGRAPSAETSPNQPSACQSGAVNRSLTVVVATPLLEMRVVVTRSRRAPPCAPSSILANDSSVRTAMAFSMDCKNCK